MKKTKLLTPMLLGVSVLTPLTSLLTACGNKASDTSETTIDAFYETTVKEFKEFVKHPHPSYYLDEARSYLTSRINSFGYDVLRDNYGNIWFDIPATKGYESWPKLILQAHMDMVIAEGIPEEMARTVGIDVVDDKDSEGRPILHSRNYMTTLGADDGIGVAMILAVAQSKINHGPIRCILTADEEEGLKGASALSTAALDSDYLLNLDGEGEMTREYIIQRGCAGLSRYHYNMEFNGTSIAAPTAGYNTFSLKVSGFFGQHFSDDVCFKADGPNAKGSANWFLFDVLQGIFGSGKKVELCSLNPTKTDEEDGNLPQEATVVFTTDATAAEITTVIDTVVGQIPTKYKLDAKSTIKPELDGSITAPSKVLNINDTSKIINYFSQLPRGALIAENWEGSTTEEKTKFNYPNSNTAFTKFTFNISEDGKGTMFAATRGTAGTDDASNAWNAENINGWKAVYPNNTIDVKKNYHPWDATGKTKMIEMAEEGFKQAGVTPEIDRTRGGLEPAAFNSKRNTLQQACIGPRMDKIHTKDETLYLDTLPNTMKCLFYVIHNMNKFE